MYVPMGQSGSLDTRDFAPPAVVDATGPFFVAIVENTFLMGALVIQGYCYWSQFHTSDKWFIKFVAVFPIFLEATQTVIVIHDGFDLFCRNFGNLTSILSPGFAWLYIAILETLTSVWVKLFYTWRLYVLTRNKWISAWIFILALISLITGIITGTVMFPFTDVREFVKIDTIASVCLITNMLCDVSIMVCMIYFLRRSQTGFKRTDTLLWQIIILSLETGALCFLFTLLHLVFWRRWPDHSWHLAVSIPEGKLYALSLLVILNQRVKLRGDSTDVQLTLGWASTTNSSASRSTAAGEQVKSGIRVNVSRQVQEEISLPTIASRKSLEVAKASNMESHGP
ncbi:hypothetical protein DL96DRAFT_1821797 [Flagelloscypha sp. PMI_526]|nr:hypothetical protein DL96DRAFT_1821797 [Flagelloscypha sp. PMI_526]